MPAWCKADDILGKYEELSETVCIPVSYTHLAAFFVRQKFAVLLHIQYNICLLYTSLADAATVFVRIGKEEEKIHRKVLSVEASLQKLAAMSEKEKDDEKIKKKISAAEKKIEDAKRKEKEFCIAVKPMYAAIADVIEHQKERPMTLWFEILDDEIAAAPGVKIEEHVVYATCVVKAVSYTHLDVYKRKSAQPAKGSCNR